MNVQDAHAEARDPTTPAERLRLLLADPALALDLADNPAAPADVLLALAKKGDPAVRAMLAGNPNITLDIVRHIGAVAPERFFANPALPLWVLERPSFFSELSGHMVLGLLRSATIPPAYLALIARYPDEEVQHTAALHIGLGGEWHQEDWEAEARAALPKARKAAVP